MLTCKFAVVFFFVIFFANYSHGAKITGKPWHHTSDGFRNPKGSPQKNSWIKRVPWLLNRPFKLMFSGSPKLPANHVMKKEEVMNGLRTTAGKNTVTWLGHMTALLRIDGKSILTDPWLTSHASPVRPLGPKRYVKPALTIKELPMIHFIVISPSHFDHLDLPTIRMMPNREKIIAIVPLGIGKYCQEYGYGKIIELDWEESVTEDGISFTALPVIHWSKRSVFTTNDTLWAGWSIKGSGGTRIFFGGDAEYGSIYRAIAKKYGGFDLSLLSIGAFLPRVVMHGSHCVPEDCIKIGNDMKANNHLGMHWGTAPLGDDKPLEAIRRFRNGAKKIGIPKERVWILKIGETRVIK